MDTDMDEAQGVDHGKDHPPTKVLVRGLVAGEGFEPS